MIRPGLGAAPAGAVAVVVLAAAIAAALQSPFPAMARDAGGAEVRRLAQDAGAGDRRALAELRDIDRVDGRAVDIGRALGASGARLRGRVRALAEGEARREPDAATARGRARRLLADERFHEPSIPRPLRGVFLWIGAGIAPLIEAAEGVVDGMASLVPGGRPVALMLVAGTALLAFTALASRGLRLRSRRRATAGARESERARGPSPEELERAAEEAERAGELSLAVRLRFRGGLLALERQGAISLRASLTTSAIAGRLGSGEFTSIASGFEEVAYGGRAADAADVEAQRSGWRRVLEEVGG